MIKSIRHFSVFKGEKSMETKVMEKILAFRDARNWKQFHTGENLAKALSIEAAELLELYQWKQETQNIEGLKEELADVFIYAYLLADAYKLDPEQIIEEKIEKNEKKYSIEKSFGNAKKYTDF